MRRIATAAMLAVSFSSFAHAYTLCSNGAHQVIMKKDEGKVIVDGKMYPVKLVPTQSGIKGFQLRGSNIVLTSIKKTITVKLGAGTMYFTAAQCQTGGSAAN